MFARVVFMIRKGWRLNSVNGQKLCRYARVFASDHVHARQNRFSPEAQIAGVADRSGNNDQTPFNLRFRRFTLLGQGARLGAVRIGPVWALFGTVFAVRGTG